MPQLTQTDIARAAQVFIDCKVLFALEFLSTPLFNELKETSPSFVNFIDGLTQAFFWRNARNILLPKLFKRMDNVHYINKEATISKHFSNQKNLDKKNACAKNYLTLFLGKPACEDVFASHLNSNHLDFNAFNELKGLEDFLFRNSEIREFILDNETSIRKIYKSYGPSITENLEELDVSNTEQLKSKCKLAVSQLKSNPDKLEILEKFKESCDAINPYLENTDYKQKIDAIYSEQIVPHLVPATPTTPKETKTRSNMPK